MVIQDSNEQEMMKLWTLVVDLSDVISRVKAQAAALNSQTQSLKVSRPDLLVNDTKVHKLSVHMFSRHKPLTQRRGSSSEGKRSSWTLLNYVLTDFIRFNQHLSKGLRALSTDHQDGVLTLGFPQRNTMPNLSGCL